MTFQSLSRRFDSSSPITVVITGASSGIGRSAALAFAGRGANVVLAARGREALDAVAKECESAGAEALVVPTDVSDAQAMRTLVHAAVTRFDGIDVWINNVGVGAVGAYDATPIEAHRRVIETNLVGHMNGAHAVLPHFRSRKRGTLINMISVGGWVPAPYATSYAASKYGLRGFSESLRAELTSLPDVHVCEVYPTFVDTPGMQHGANYSGKTVRPPPPLVDPRRVADLLVSLARSPRAVTSIGSVALPSRAAHTVAPNLTGRVTRMLMDAAFEKANPAPRSEGNLYEPSRNPAIDGGYRQANAESSKSPLAALAVAGALGLGLLLATRANRAGGWPARGGWRAWNGRVRNFRVADRPF